MSKPERNILWLAVAIIILGWVITYKMSGQTGPSGNNWRIKPQVLAVNTAVDVCTLSGGPPCGQDVGICYADASTGATPSTLSISDRQSTPVFYFNGVALAANTTYASIFDSKGSINCRWFPGGVTVQASVANAISIEMSGRF